MRPSAGHCADLAVTSGHTAGALRAGACGRFAGRYLGVVTPSSQVRLNPQRASQLRHTEEVTFHREFRLQCVGCQRSLQCLGFHTEALANPSAKAFGRSWMRRAVLCNWSWQFQLNLSEMAGRCG
eukprot:gene17541-biopygen13245